MVLQYLSDKIKMSLKTQTFSIIKPDAIEANTSKILDFLENKGFKF